VLLVLYRVFLRYGWAALRASRLALHRLKLRELPDRSNFPLVDLLDRLRSDVVACRRGVRLIAVLQLLQLLLEVDLRNFLARVGLRFRLPPSDPRQYIAKVAASRLDLSEQLSDFAGTTLLAGALRL